MKVLGLTGPSGSGKGYTERVFSSFGVPFIDTDGVYHALVSNDSPCTRELRTHFGNFVIRKDGALDRKALATHVFCGGEEEKKRLALLNSITHKYVLDNVRAWMTEKRNQGYKAVMIDAPLLYESGFDCECDAVIAVLAPRALRLQRIMERDGLSETAALSRINAQPSDDFYKERADFIIYNDADEDAVKKEAVKILSSLALL